MNKEVLIKVTNRDTGRVGYQVPEMNVRRQFMSNETKEIPFGELEALSYLPGGIRILSEFLVIQNEDAVKELLHGVEPEYYYSEEDIKRLMTTGSLDEFLDCLDFAPDGTKELIKDLSVSLPLDNMSKRDAILNKLNFNVTRAIEIQNTKFDGDTEQVEEVKPAGRRVAAPKNGVSETGRRTQVPKYKVTSTQQ